MIAINVRIKKCKYSDKTVWRKKAECTFDSDLKMSKQRHIFDDGIW